MLQTTITNTTAHIHRFTSNGPDSIAMLILQNVLVVVL